MPIQDPNTPHVTWVDRGGDVAALQVVVYFDLTKLREITGIDDRAAIAAWLEAQRPHLDEMLSDGHARDTIEGYLVNYAHEDREELLRLRAELGELERMRAVEGKMRARIAELEATGARERA